MNKFLSEQGSQKGFGLVEILIGSAILSLALLSISNFFRTTLHASRQTEAVVQGDYLLEEGIEIVKLWRDMSYTNNIRNMSTTSPRYFLWNGTYWATSTTNTFIDGKFERKVTFTDVKRDGNNDIAAVGTYDPNVKLIQVSVSWLVPNTGTTTRSIQTYITNIGNN